MFDRENLIKIQETSINQVGVGRLVVVVVRCARRGEGGYLSAAHPAGNAVSNCAAPCTAVIVPTFVFDWSVSSYKYATRIVPVQILSAKPAVPLSSKLRNTFLFMSRNRIPFCFMIDAIYLKRKEERKEANVIVGIPTTTERTKSWKWRKNALSAVCVCVSSSFFVSSLMSALVLYTSRLYM